MVKAEETEKAEEALIISSKMIMLVIMKDSTHYHISTFSPLTYSPSHLLTFSLSNREYRLPPQHSYRSRQIFAGRLKEFRQRHGQHIS